GGNEGAGSEARAQSAVHSRKFFLYDVLKLGDIVKVKVSKITDKGVNVSRKALLPKPIKQKEEKKNEE
ncbi:MAG: hypothetical protein HFF37_04005, partial [Coprobacillus sp.]|nr:hypothetical protein [Coprobacillus sp.]